MKSDIDIEDILYEYIKGSTLEDAVTGELRKGDRRKGSASEDIIIVAISNLNGEIQMATANVNVYVPDVLIDGELMADRPRLRDLCNMSKTLLEVFNAGGWRITLNQQRVVDCNDTHEHCICNQLNFQFYNRQ